MQPETHARNTVHGERGADKAKTVMIADAMINNRCSTWSTRESCGNDFGDPIARITVMRPTRVVERYHPPMIGDEIPVS